MDSIYLSEAFKQLKILDEEDFQLSADVDATDKIKDFVDQDEVSDDIEVIDTEAETEEELQDSYIGKVILDCPVCHSKIYKNPEEVVVSEEDQSLVNTDEECPYCYTVGGFKVIGEVAPYEEAEETAELDYSPEEDEEDIEVDDIQEALRKGKTVKYKGEPVKVLKVSKDDPDYGEIKYRGKKVFTNDFDESLKEGYIGDGYITDDARDYFADDEDTIEYIGSDGSVYTYDANYYKIEFSDGYSDIIPKEYIEIEEEDDFDESLNEALPISAFDNIEEFEKYLDDKSVELRNKFNEFRRLKIKKSDPRYKRALEDSKELSRLIRDLEARKSDSEYVSKARLVNIIKKITNLSTVKTHTTRIRGFRTISEGSFEVIDYYGDGRTYLVSFYNNKDKLDEVINELTNLGFEVTPSSNSSYSFLVSAFKKQKSEVPYTESLDRKKLKEAIDLDFNDCDFKIIKHIDTDVYLCFDEVSQKYYTVDLTNAEILDGGISNLKDALKLADETAEYMTFFDESLDRKKLKECINRLNEAEMSDEDKADSELLWGIYKKLKKRSNARLTPEESQVFNKYGLGKDVTHKDIVSPPYPYDTKLIDRRHFVKNKETGEYEPNPEVNLADRARKIRSRGQGYEASLTTPWSDRYGHTFSSIDSNKRIPEDRDQSIFPGKGLLDKERIDQNLNMSKNVRSMKAALNARKDAQFVMDKYKERRDSADSYINGLLKKDKAIDENFEKVNIETDKEIMSMESDDSGKVSVVTQPKEEVIVPVSTELQDEIDVTNDLYQDDDVDSFDYQDDIEVNDDGTVDQEFDEFDEESFDKLGESYLKNTYNNVSSFRTSNIKSSGNKLFIEGVITFNSGNKKDTNFIFEGKDITRRGTIRFIGENQEITKGKKAFSLLGRVDNNKLYLESLTYNYRAKLTEGNKSQKVYGTVRINENLNKSK